VISLRVERVVKTSPQEAQRTVAITRVGWTVKLGSSFVWSKRSDAIAQRAAETYLRARTHMEVNAPASRDIPARISQKVIR
jgi:hypothetical protein